MGCTTGHRDKKFMIEMLQGMARLREEVQQGQRHWFRIIFSNECKMELEILRRERETSDDRDADDVKSYKSK